MNSFSHTNDSLKVWWKIQTCMYYWDVLLLLSQFKLYLYIILKKTLQVNSRKNLGKYKQKDINFMTVKREIEHKVFISLGLYDGNLSFEH